MGETSKDYAESKRNHLIRVLSKVQQSASDNFEDMDISNNSGQLAIKTEIEGIINDCQSVIDTLNNLSFE